MRKAVCHGLLFAAVAMVTTIAAAEENASRKKDPNRVICEKQEVVGSRLAVKRVCMTAAEWEARRLEQRQSIDRSQSQRGSSGN